MASQIELKSPEPIWHEHVEETDHLPVYISTPGRGSCSQGCQHREDGMTVSAHWHEYVEFIWLREGISLLLSRRIPMSWNRETC